MWFPLTFCSTISIRPGSDFYLVFNQIYDSNGGGVSLEESTLVGKLTYWWNP